MAVGALFLVLLSYTEHTRSVKPSLILNAYLLVSLLFDIAKVRTLWLRSTNSFNDGIAIVTTVSLGAKLLLAFLEAIEKRNILKHEFADYPPEATAGLYNKATFWWLNPLFKNGFSNILSVEDLSVLDKELSSERLLALFEERWSKGKLHCVQYFKSVTNSPSSEIQVCKHTAIRVIQGHQGPSSRRHTRQGMRRGLQCLPASAPDTIDFLFQ